jgi:glycosyltransferase involved in cell wall biosynthesis
LKILIVANLYPTEDRQHFGVFVKKIEDNLNENDLQTEHIVLPEFGRGLSAYLKFYFFTFFYLLKSDHVAYVHYVSHSVIPVVLAKVLKWNLKIILNYHGSDAFPDEQHGLIGRCFRDGVCHLANKVSDAIILPSDFFKKEFLKKFKSKTPIFVSPSGGVDFDGIKVNPHRALKGEAHSLLFASRMIEGKGAIIAAKAIKNTIEQNELITATFIGEGNEKAKVVEILNQVDGIQYFDGLPQEKLFEHMDSSDFFLFPSTRKGESLGLVLIEAMARGCIPIAIRNGATPDILDFCPEFLLANDEDEFIQKTLGLITLPEPQILKIREQINVKLRQFDSRIVGSDLVRFLKEL